MQFVPCTYDSHAAAILAIFNDAIAHTTALYDYQPRAPESMAGWFETKKSADYPVIGAVDDAGTLMGFASYGEFRERPAYKYTIEHSVYVHPDHRGHGLGATLMRQLIDAATEQEYHVMIGGVDTSNVASIALHEKLGFELAGTIRHAGYKFGRWLDLAFYQLVLETPRNPVER